MAIVHPVEPMEYGNALTYIERWLEDNFIDEEHRAKGFEAQVYDYFSRNPAGLQQRPFCGVRVSEVSFSNSRGGSSYMQSDAPVGIAVCGQAERCILALVEGWNSDQTTSDGEVYGQADEEFARLEMILKEDF